MGSQFVVGHDSLDYNYEPPYESFPSNDHLSHRDNDVYANNDFARNFGYNCDRNTPHRLE